MRILALGLALLPAAAFAQGSLDTAVREAVTAGRAAVASQKSLAKRLGLEARAAAPVSRPPGGINGRSAVRCTFRTIESRDCVYRCADGSEYRTPVAQPSPIDPDPIACLQFVWRW